MTIYGFWNNKGGTGKTSLAFQAACFYASAHPQDRVLVIDMCPQANMSELLLGGLGNGSDIPLATGPNTQGIHRRLLPDASPFPLQDPGVQSQ